MSESKKHPLIDYLLSRREDRAVLAALRRGLGQPPGAAPEMFPHVAPFVRRTTQEVPLYMVAALFALHPRHAEGVNLGAALRRYAPEGSAREDGVERRFTQLLRMRLDDLDAPLRQMITLIKGDDVPLDWHQLLSDVLAWEHESRYVQRQWARSFWQRSASAAAE